MSEEFGSKNWIKIPIKLALWMVMVIVAFRIMRRGAITPAGRKWMYLSAVALFGVILGNEPSPLNALTDTIALLGQKGSIFPPRAVVLSVFLVIVVLANKFICAWGCQFGTLQDLLFRLNRDRDERSILRQVKLPFAATNTVRAVVFVLFTVLALGWGLDSIAPVNPFKISMPAAVTTGGGVLLGLLALGPVRAPPLVSPVLPLRVHRVDCGEGETLPDPGELRDLYFLRTMRSGLSIDGDGRHPEAGPHGRGLFLLRHLHRHLPHEIDLVPVGETGASAGG